jgi:hypothetical protein
MEQLENKKISNSAIQPPSIGEALASWEYPEFMQFERGWRWYLIAGVVTLGLAAYAIWDKNWLFLIIIVFSTLIFALANMRPPERLHVIISNKGIILRDKFLAYQDIKNFWMIYQPPMVKSLYIEPRSFIIPRLHIHLEDQNPVEIREILLQFLEEDFSKEEEPQSEFLGRLLKL